MGVLSISIARRGLHGGCLEWCKTWKAVQAGIVCAALWYASPKGRAYELEDPYVAVRPTGMGGAFCALANDQNAPWTNPAGVGRIRKARAQSIVHYASFPNFIGGANKEGSSLYSQFTSSQEARSSEVSDKLKTLAESSSLRGVNKPFWLRGGISPMAFVEVAKGRPIVLGAFTDTRMKISLLEEGDGVLGKLESISDIGAILGVGWSNRSNRLNAGIQTRPISRYAYDDKLPGEVLFDQTALQTRLQTEANTTAAVAIDAGVLWTMADFWFPSVGIAVFNAPVGCAEDYLNAFTETRQTVCGTKFTGSVKNPESRFLVDPMDLRLGVAISPRLSRKLGLRFALDMHHLYVDTGKEVYGLSGLDPQKQMHAGMEVYLGNPLAINPLSLRFGYNQGFLTVGGSVRIGFLAIEVANFGTDISSASSPQEDRRTLITVSSEY